MPNSNPILLFALKKVCRKDVEIHFAQSQEKFEAKALKFSSNYERTRKKERQICSLFSVQNNDKKINVVESMAMSCFNIFGCKIQLAKQKKFLNRILLFLNQKESRCWAQF